MMCTHSRGVSHDVQPSNRGTPLHRVHIIKNTSDIIRVHIIKNTSARKDLRAAQLGEATDSVPQGPLMYVQYFMAFEEVLKIHSTKHVEYKIFFI